MSAALLGIKSADRSKIERRIVFCVLRFKM